MRAFLKTLRITRFASTTGMHTRRVYTSLNGCCAAFLRVAQAYAISRRRSRDASRELVAFHEGLSLPLQISVAFRRNHMHLCVSHFYSNVYSTSNKCWCFTRNLRQNSGCGQKTTRQALIIRARPPVTRYQTKKKKDLVTSSADCPAAGDFGGYAQQMHTRL